jgi:serine/threonine-protein kinase RsbW
MSDAVVHLSFPAKPDYLLLARLALSGLARDTALGDEVLADLKLAVTEACGNSIRHAYPDGVGNVSVSYVMRDGAIEMIVEDQGAGLEPGDLGAKRPSGLMESGMGMSIIETIVDELVVSSGADGRGIVVRMTKHLAPADV